MESYAEMMERQQQEVNNFPFGFVFGQEQFDKIMKKWGLNPEQDTGKIYSLGAGCYIRKKDADLLHQM